MKTPITWEGPEPDNFPCMTDGCKNRALWLVTPDIINYEVNLCLCPDCAAIVTAARSEHAMFSYLGGEGKRVS